MCVAVPQGGGWALLRFWVALSLSFPGIVCAGGCPRLGWMVAPRGRGLFVRFLAGRFGGQPGVASVQAQFDATWRAAGVLNEVDAQGSNCPGSDERGGSK